MWMSLINHLLLTIGCAMMTFNLWSAGKDTVTIWMIATIVMATNVGLDLAGIAERGGME